MEVAILQSNEWVGINMPRRMVLVITSDRVAQLREALSAAISHQAVILNCGLDIILLLY